MVVGLVLVVLGLIAMARPGLPPLFRLPGDIRIERDGFTLYVPVTTSILLGVLFSAALWVAARLR